MAVRTAILSDIHGNLEALEAVLADAAACGADRFVCLGDILGFGADVVACVDRVREVCAWSLLGHHEWMLREHVAGRTASWGAAARERLDWEAVQLAPRKAGAPDSVVRWEWLRGLQRQVWEGKRTYVHGCPSDPVSGWFFPQYEQYANALQSELDLIESVCLHGHTHVPVAVINGHVHQFAGDATHFELPEDGKALINVGAVGQPGDGDPRASYALATTSGVMIRRVTYDEIGRAHV